MEESCEDTVDALDSSSDTIKAELFCYDSQESSSESHLDLSEMGTRNSATTGLTMKEYEEQLKKLTAENFNLKLRVYFVEERLSKIHGINDKEDLIKKNIQLKVTCESQSKELEKKQELLFEASKAFELLQREHKEEIDKIVKEKEKEKSELESKTQALEETLKELKARLACFHDSDDVSTFQLYDKQIMELENHLHEEEERSRELETILRDSQIDIERLEVKCETMEKELEQRSRRIEELVNELEQKEHDLSDANLRVRKMEDEKSTKQREDDAMKDRLGEKNKTIEALKNSLSAKDASISALENRLAKERCMLQSLQSKMDTLNFQNIRLKEEIEMLQCRLRRGADVSPRSKSARSADEDGYRQKYEELLRLVEQRDLHHAKQAKEMEEMISYKGADNAEFQQLCSKYKKLEDDHRKACAALKNFIKRSAEDKKEREALNELVKSRDDVIKELNNRIESHTGHSASRENQDDKSTFAAAADNSEECAKDDKDSCCRQKEKQIQVILSNLNTKEKLLEEYEQKMLMCSCGVEDKVERISDLEAEVIVLKYQLDDKSNETMDSMKELLTSELESKKCEIEKLNCDLKRRTYNLQELVNKELWDKNRQIEKLEKRINSILERNEAEVMKLNQEIHARDQQLKILQDKVGELGITANMPPSLAGLTRTTEAVDADFEENASSEDVGGLKTQLKRSCEEKKYLHRKVEELKEKLRNTPERDCGSLKAECAKAKEQAEKAEAFRRDAAEVCSLLTVRLEELAGFLDSLLTGRDGLSIKRRQAMKQAVEQSRELSRHLSLSFANRTLEDSAVWHSGEESCGDGLGDKFASVLQESPKDSISKSRDKVISEQSAMIARLREQLRLLNQQVKQRDIELSLCQSSRLDLNYSDGDAPDESSRRTLEISRFEKSCQKILVVPESKWKSKSHEASESESWSEPDRNVSLARMGLIEDVSASSVRSFNCPHSTGSSEETLNENSRTSVKRTRSTESEIRRLQSKVKLLDEANETLRLELNSLKNSRLDGTFLTKMQMNDELNLAEKLRKTIEKLEESRLTCSQLEEKLSEALERASVSAAQLSKANESLAVMETEVRRLQEELASRKIESEERIKKISELESRMEEANLENELRMIEALKQKELAERKTLEVECKLKDAENMSRDVESRVMEIEKKFHETKKFKKETVLHFKEAEKHVDTAERIMEEAERMKLEAERKSKDLQNFVDLMRKEVEEKVKDSERRVKRAEKEKEEAEKQVAKLKKRLLEAEKNKTEVETKVKEGKETIQCMEEKLKELEIAMDQCNEEAQHRIKEIQKKAEARVQELELEMEKREWMRRTEAEKKMTEAEKISKELELGFKKQLEEADKKMKKTRDNAEEAIRKIQEDFRKQETELRERLAQVEIEKKETCSDLRRQLDEIRVEASEYEVELTRLTNEKIHLEEELKRMLDKESELVKDHNEIRGKYEKSIHDLEVKLSELALNKSELAIRLEEIESTNLDLVTRISAIRGKEASGPDNEGSSWSPPTSPLVPQGSLLCSLLSEVELCLPEVNGNRHILRQSSTNSDPGEQAVLGVQSIEAFAPPRRNLNSSPDLGIDSDPGRFSSLEHQNGILAIDHKEESDMKKLEFENAELRRRLVKTRQALEETLTQLSAANQRKKQVERAICKQLHKTHHILKKARVNFEGPDVDSVE